MKPEPFTLLRLVVALRGEASTNTFTRTAMVHSSVSPSVTAPCVASSRTS